MNGVRFHYQAGEARRPAPSSTTENHRAAAQYARGDALDVFCYQGAFALHLAPRCAR